MKFNPLQEDFSAGELAPGFQGKVNSDAYKSGLGRAANVAPTRTGSVASRAGGRWLLDGLDLHMGAPSNGVVQHITIENGPYGDFAIEVSQKGVRLLDGSGVQDTFRFQKNTYLRFDVQDGLNAFALDDVVYLSNASGVGQKSYVLTQGDDGTANIPTSPGSPVGTNNHWTLTGELAGDPVVVNAFYETNHLFVIQPGPFSVDMDLALVANLALTLKTEAGQVSASKLWNLRLTKNTVPVGFDVTAAGLVSDPLSTDRVRAVGFWTQADKPYKGCPAMFWVAFAGGPKGAWAGYGLQWVQGPEGAWSFMQLPCTPGSLDVIQGSTAVAAYQDRLWYGSNSASGRSQLIGSRVGFTNLYLQRWLGASVRTIALTGPVNALGDSASVAFEFTRQVETHVVGAGSPIESINSSYYNVPGHVSGTWGSTFDFLSGITVPVVGSLAFQQPAIRVRWAKAASPTIFDELVQQEAIRTQSETDPTSGRYDPPEGGKFYSLAGVVPQKSNYALGVAVSIVADATAVRVNGTGPGPAAGDVLEVSTQPAAEDPLNLTLASPTGAIAWINVLRGLMMGTTTNEKLFDSSETVALDPATGAAPNAIDESSLGADTALPALDVGDKVLFVQRGREVLRMASISIATSGGLVSEDVGAIGEHLTKAVIQSMCYLKGPVPRVVFAFDDGTGAVLTLGGKTGQAWSRFTLPAAYGGIYSVAALNGARGSELFVGTENGVTLHWRSFESRPSTRLLRVAQAAPAAPVKANVDPESVLPPVCDGWEHRAVFVVGGVAKVQVGSTSLIGQSVYAFAQGQMYGPFVVAGDGTVTLAGLPAANIWLDGVGARRPLDVYLGVVFSEHGFTTLPLEGGNPVGTAQNLTSRKPQLYLRLVDSYLPEVNGSLPDTPERQPSDLMDMLPARTTGDVRATELNFQRAAVVDVEMPLPLRMEVAAIFGGATMNNV